MRLFAHPQIMGIINVTPDSFSDGGPLFRNPSMCAPFARRMIANGADIIDIGGEAAGPTAQPVGWREDARRVLPVIRELRDELPDTIPLSVNTRYPEVARSAIEIGATIINCTGACAFDVQMMSVIAESGCHIILFDLPTRMGSGTAGRDLQSVPVVDVIHFLERQANACIASGIEADKIWIDPGFGHPHTSGDILEMLRRLDEFTALGYPVVVGVSRKQHLGQHTQRILNLADLPGPLSRLDAALAETAWAIIMGAEILRTHDVRSTRIVASLVAEISSL